MTNIESDRVVSWSPLSGWSNAIKIRNNDVQIIEGIYIKILYGSTKETFVLYAENVFEESFEVISGETLGDISRKKTSDRLTGRIFILEAIYL